MWGYIKGVGGSFNPWLSHIYGMLQDQCDAYITTKDWQLRLGIGQPTKRLSNGMFGNRIFNLYYFQR